MVPYQHQLFPCEIGGSYRKRILKQHSRNNVCCFVTVVRVRHAKIPDRGQGNSDDAKVFVRGSNDGASNAYSCIRD